MIFFIVTFFSSDATRGEANYEAVKEMKKKMWGKENELIKMRNRRWRKEDEEKGNGENGKERKWWIQNNI